MRLIITMHKKRYLYSVEVPFFIYLNSDRVFLPMYILLVLQNDFVTLLIIYFDIHIIGLNLKLYFDSLEVSIWAKMFMSCWYLDS